MFSAIRYILSDVFGSNHNVINEIRMKTKTQVNVDSILITPCVMYALSRYVIFKQFLLVIYLLKIGIIIAAVVDTAFRCIINEYNMDG